MSSLTLVPAYNRDYQTQEEVLQAWQKDQDFLVRTVGPYDGSYMNRSDAERYLKHTRLVVRYSQLTQITTVQTGD